MKHNVKKILKKTIKYMINSLGFDLKKINIKDSYIPETFFEVDMNFNNLYDLAQSKTLMQSSDNCLRRQRHYSLQYLLRQVDIHNGDIAECGCWKGLSSYQIAFYLKQNSFRNKFYIFDSFEGLSEFENSDLAGDRSIDKDAWRKQFVCSLDTVRQNLNEFEFIEYKKGWIPKRFSEIEGGKFIFVNIDVDLYQPTRDALEFFYDRVLKGGIITFDDYGCLYFPGAKRAIDEFMHDKRDFFLPLTSGSAFLIKS